MAQFNDRKNVDNNWTGGKGEDTMRGQGGNDTINGGGGSDWLYGGTGNDILIGGAGGDYIRGDQGTDTLTGGTGADRFEFLPAGSDTVNGIDTITDYNPAEGDGIYLAFDYASDNAQIYFVAAPSGTRDELTLTYDPNTNVTTANLYLADGNTMADLILYLTGQHLSPDGFYNVI